MSPWPTGVELAGAVELRRCVVAQRRVEICRCYWPSLSRGQKCKISCKRRNSRAQRSRIQPKLPTVLPLETPLNSHCFLTSGSHLKRPLPEVSAPMAVTFLTVAQEMAPQGSSSAKAVLDVILEGFSRSCSFSPCNDFFSN